MPFRLPGRVRRLSVGSVVVRAVESPDTEDTGADGPGRLRYALGPVLQLALANVAGARASSVVARGGDGQLVTLMAAGNGSWVLDAAQLADEGPCVDAVANGEPSRAVLPDPRWPALSAAARESGTSAVVSVPGQVGGRPEMALNLYGATGELWRSPSMRTARLLADHAAWLLAYSSELSEARREATNLKFALESRTVIAQAQGILMGRQHINSAAAFDVLRRASQRSNTKLRDMAADIVAQTAVCANGH